MNEMEAGIAKKLELNSLKFKHSKLFFFKSVAQESKICNDVVYAFHCFNNHKECDRSKFKSERVKNLLKSIDEINRDVIKEKIILPHIHYLDLVVEFEDYIYKIRLNNIKIAISIVIPISVALITGFITGFIAFAKFTSG